MTLLDDLRAADAAMTPGPWTDRANHKPYRIVVFGGKKAYDAGLTTSDIVAADAAGIALMRNALPKLLAVVEAAQLYLDGPEGWQELIRALAALEETP